MNLKTYFMPLLKYWWLLFAAAIVAMSTTFVVTRSQPSIYQTRATLVVGNMMYETNPSGNDIYLGQQLAAYYARIGMQAEVSSSTQEALNMSWLPQYTINPLPNSQFIEVVVNDTNPARAQAVANELAKQLMNHSPTSDLQQGSDQQAFINEQVSYLEERISDTLVEIDAAEKELSETNSAQKIAEIQVEIIALQAKLSQMQSNYAALVANTGQGAVNTLSVIEPAPLPTTAVGPSKLIMTLIAGVVAAGIAAVAAYILEFLDDSIKTPEEIKKFLAIPTLSTISSIHPAMDTRLPPQGSFVKRVLNQIRIPKKTIDASEDIARYSANFPNSAVSEEFRMLRIHLDAASVGEPLKSILVTSSSPTEGKSTIASNLAIVMAESGRKVVLLDVNFDHLGMDQYDLFEERGLSSILDGSLTVDDVIQTWQENLSFIGAGSAPSSPVDFFSSKKMAQLLEELDQISDMVIIDGPPLASTSALALSPKVDGVLVVFRHGYTRRGTAQTQVAKLTQIGANVIGAVLNNKPISWMGN